MYWSDFHEAFTTKRSDGIRKIGNPIVVPRGCVGRPVSLEITQYALNPAGSNADSHIVFGTRTRNTAANTLALYRQWINGGRQLAYSHLGSSFVATVSNQVFKQPQDTVIKRFSEEEIRVGSINTTGRNVTGVPESLGDNRFWGAWAFMHFADTPNDEAVAIYMKFVYELEWMRDTAPSPNLPMTMLGSSIHG